MNKLVFKCPLNSLSFGNVSVNLLKEMYKSNMSISVFPIGENVDIKAFDKLSNDFKAWLQDSINNRITTVDKDVPTLQLWHLNGSENRITKKQFLFSFYELDAPTLVEKKLADLQDAVIFSSSFAQEQFTKQGYPDCSNIETVKLGFDQDFFTTGKKYLSEDKIHFGLMGKFEKRKHTAKILKTWAKKYGNNYKYQLSCCISNPFFSPEDNEKCLFQALEGKRYGNINFLPHLETNSEVNEYLNAIDIDLSGLSGGEGWNLPAFNSSCLGKWSIVLNASSHKDWANKDNCILMNPNGKEDSEDGVFFKKGSPFNQGNIYTFDEDELVEKMEIAENKCKTQNKLGLEMQKTFTYSNTLKQILDIINKYQTRQNVTT